MNRRIFLLVISLSIIFTGCSNNINQHNEKISDETFLLGTIVKVTLYGKNADEDNFKDIFNIISDIENKVSRNISTSEISKINSNEIQEIKLSDDTFNIIKKGLYYSNLSEGRFDITIAPLVSLWGIGTEDARVPEEQEIKEAVNKIDYKNIYLEDDKMNMHIKNDVQIDLGGIAKGYVADKVAEYIKQKHIDHALINLGGNILTVGHKPNGESWKIGVQNPFNARGKELGVATIGEKSIVTSGIYERYFEEDGKRYHHILNPFTGYPIENDLAGVTIISDYSVDGDGLSTVVFSMGLEEGYKFVENLENVDAIFVTDEKDIYLTDGTEKIFNLTDYDFKVKKFSN
ncbi:FAD:protein FMN transferase [Vallitalea longa]|uniref:FAD:protein FMN transferase n=1 Tax=Vallitalea longa TaxID=2936439 RepID=A0A9W5Y9H3_9FIRM|nr:FAD:protein FMN transferase [Vallitalea longa]GKX28505.1 FAD:protein FMN transferase [Vallitalea longa]